MNWIDLSSKLPWVKGEKIHLIQQSDARRLVDELKQLGFEIVKIDGKQIIDEESFFAEIAKVCGFPDYFGNNWDAFNDSFYEYCIQKKRPIAVIWSHAMIAHDENLYSFLKITYELVSIASDMGSLNGSFEQIQAAVFHVGDF